MDPAQSPETEPAVQHQAANSEPQDSRPGDAAPHNPGAAQETPHHQAGEPNTLPDGSADNQHETQLSQRGNLIISESAHHPRTAQQPFEETIPFSSAPPYAYHDTSPRLANAADDTPSPIATGRSGADNDPGQEASWEANDLSKMQRRHRSE